MNLASPSRVRAFLAEIGLRPRKTLGQNFLVDANVLSILLRAADVGSSDHVLEIGPGLGVVTGPLLERAGRVTAVEKDPRLFEFLRKRHGNEPRLELICADALRLDWGAEAGPRAETRPGGPRVRDVDAVVSNLPYSVGSRILAKIAMLETPPRSVTVTVQREVGERLTAGPGSPAYGLLGVWLQSVYQVERVHKVARGCFWPAPEVESAIVRLRVRTPLPASPAERGVFFDLTKGVFAHRRKQMTAILGRVLPRPASRGPSAKDLLQEAGIPPSARPEDLSGEDFFRLVRVLRGQGRAA